MAVTIDEQHTGVHRVRKISLGAGDQAIVPVLEKEAIVAAAPGGGGTILVEASWSLQNEIENNTANWHSWDHGTVSAKANQLLIGATAIRVTATTQPGVVEVSA
jgi:hypothetical protein